MSDTAAAVDLGGATADLGVAADLAGTATDALAAVEAGLSSRASALEGEACNPPTSQVVINEIMFHPAKVTDANGEWFEVHNPGASIIDLKDWVIKGTGSESHKILTTVLVSPGGYTTLCRNGNSLQNGGVTCGYTYAGILLDDVASDLIQLVNPGGAIVDEVAWTASPTNLPPTGKAVGLRHPYLDNATVTFPANPNDAAGWATSNWGLSTLAIGGVTTNDKGTPGAKNTDLWADRELQECADGNVCTKDLCEAGKCSNPWISGCCLANADCDDNNPCTADSCDVANKTCIHTGSATCCTKNEDCVDENPCNTDYCLANECRHSTYDTVQFCCWAPVNDPATGDPWTDEAAKQAYANSQCDDKNKCTKSDYCDLGANQCHSGTLDPNCCTLNADCDDGNPCTTDLCEASQCISTQKDPLCCRLDGDCEDNDPCTDDVCLNNTCRYFFNGVEGNGCCDDDNWCMKYNDDGNACTAEKCIKDLNGWRSCQHVFVPTCSVPLPYVESFDTAVSFTQIGWKLYDFGTKAADHWTLPTTGELGGTTAHDRLLKFVWNPTTVKVKSVTVTPRLDASIDDQWNTLDKTTLQFRMVYKHSMAGAQPPVTLRVVASVASDLSDTTDGHMDIWRLDNVDQDLPYQIVTAEVPSTVWNSDKLRIGFVVDTLDASTFGMDNWQIDDVQVAFGVPNQFLKARVFHCDPNQTVCDASHNLGEVDTFPTVAMSSCDWFRIYLCYRDEDASFYTWQYYGFPTGYVDGKPLDPAPFVTEFKANEGEQGGCITTPAVRVTEMCGEGATYMCALDAKPGCTDDFAGYYRSGLVSKDEYRAGAQVHSPFESLVRFDLSVLIPSGIIIWSPLGNSHPSAMALREALSLIPDVQVQIVPDLSLIADLTNYEAVFAVLGVYGEYHEMTTADPITGEPGEAERLASYIQNGGRVYLEGGDFFYTAGTEQVATVLHPYFKIEATSTGGSKITDPINGRAFLADYHFTYDPGPDFNAWNDRLVHQTGTTSFEVLRVEGTKDFASTVAYDEGAGQYKIIGSSVLFGGLVDPASGQPCSAQMTSDCAAVAAKYLYFLRYGYPPCVEDTECNDSEVCTDDRCVNGTCTNTTIASCTACANDCLMGDGLTPSCELDEACSKALGYCIPIEGTRFDVASGACPTQGFGANPYPAFVSCPLTVAMPGNVTDLEVKVKVTHPYRGDVKLKLRNPSGTEVVLRPGAQADSADNVCETYDVGAAPFQALTGFIGQPLNGTWTLVAEDTATGNGQNGFLESWHLFAKYQQKACPSGASDCPDVPCNTKQCQGGTCLYTPLDCNDDSLCTTDSCDPLTGQCVHEKPATGCGACRAHADCGFDQVCLFTDGSVCADRDNCECELIEGTPYPATTGLPAPIPDNNPAGVTRTMTLDPATVTGNIKKLRVKVVTDHPSMFQLTAKLCHLGTCVMLHNLTGSGPDLYRVWDYDEVDGPGVVADFKKLPIAGAWTLTVADRVAGPAATQSITAWTVYVVEADCYTNEDCDDANVCTTDACQEGVDGGTCVHTMMPCAPTDDPCVVNECNPANGQCEQRDQLDGTPCEDGTFCAVEDFCVAGKCTAGAPRDCSAVGDPAQCLEGYCNEDTHQCLRRQIGDGAACDDGWFCTVGDTCQSGVCMPGPADSCSCNQDEDCDDGNNCNGTQVCDLGTKTCKNEETPFVCAAPTAQCRRSVCEDTTHVWPPVCKEVVSNNYDPCEDGLYCTWADFCQTGACVGGEPRDCSMLDDVCLDGTCDDDANVCGTTPKDNGTSCEADGDGCTIDECDAGTCSPTGIPVDCSAQTDDCNTGTCVPFGWGGHSCTPTPADDGQMCSDEPDPCTTDTCLSGVCKHAQVNHCNAKCGGDHLYDAGDDRCGVEDSCVGGIGGCTDPDNRATCAGNCSPTINEADATWKSAASGTIDLPVNEQVVGCTISSVTISGAATYVEDAQLKLDLDHDYLGDLQIDLVTPQGYIHRVWDTLGGSQQDFDDTFTKSIPVPYTGKPTSGVPMCSLKGEQANGQWFLKVCDIGAGNGGVLHKWKLYVKGSTSTTLNPGHRYADAIDIGAAEKTLEIYGDLPNDASHPFNTSATTQCGVNVASSNCFGTGGAERIYKFTIPSTRRITINLQQTSRDMILYLSPSAGSCTAGTPGCLCSNLYAMGAQNEVVDAVLPAGTYYIGVESNGGRYSYGTFRMTYRVKTPMADGASCIDPVLGAQDLDCIASHCQNGYCCVSGDCCPSEAWTVPTNGQDPNPVKTTAEWISANAVCPAAYKASNTCTDPTNCQGKRSDARCVNHICVKTDVPDDIACTTAVTSDTCGYWVSKMCNAQPVQTKPPCPAYCNADGECDANAHCDPSGQPAAGPTVADPPAGTNTMICTVDLANGSASNENSDCTSAHTANGYCCATGDCCPTNNQAGALKCPASYTTAATCDLQATCEGHRKDPVCSNFQCSTTTVHDDCACAGLVSDNCGMYISSRCAATMPTGTCPGTPLGSQTPWHAGTPPCLTTCLVGGVETDAKCDDYAHCDPDPANLTNSICVGDVPDGLPCNEGSDCANDLPPTHPGYCNNGFCCDHGTCCNVNTDCPTLNPTRSGFWQPSVCDSQADCQGHRMDATCTSSICGTVAVADDTGCTTAMLSDDCSYYLPVYCTGAASQPATGTACPTTCLVGGVETDTKCDANGHCDPEAGNPANSVCVADLPVCPGVTDVCTRCDENSDCVTGGVCQINYCCTAGGCCKGCNVESVLMNAGGGGTLESKSQGSWYTTFGQGSTAGEATSGAGWKFNQGFMPGATSPK